MDLKGLHTVHVQKLHGVGLVNLYCIRRSWYLHPERAFELEYISVNQ